MEKKGNTKSKIEETKEQLESEHKAHDDVYGSGYENNRNDYRSKLEQDSSNTDASSHSTAESNTHRSGQAAHHSNDNKEDRDSYQERN